MLSLISAEVVPEMTPRRLDLHGLTVDEAIATFVQEYNRLVAGGFRGRIEVVHGYGSSGEGGAIRRRLRSFLEANRDRFRHVTAGDARGNPGVTYVEPRGRLTVSRTVTPVEQAILGFCEKPRTEKRILAKLVGRFGDPAIRGAIREMVREGSLREVRGAGEIKYAAA